MADFSFVDGNAPTDVQWNANVRDQLVTICTASTRPTSPVTGRQIWQTDTATGFYYSGTAWAPNGTRMAPRGPIRNASFAVWQRGTTVTPAANAYGADGWQNFYRADIVHSQVVAVDTQGSGYCMRIQRPNANAVTTTLGLGHAITTKQSLRFAGRQLTFSVRARKGSGSTLAFGSCNVNSGTGTDQNVGTGFTGEVLVGTATGIASLSTSWQTFSVTATPGLSATQLGIFISFTCSGTAGASDYVDIKDVDIIEGPAVISREHLPYPADLAECQQYFWRCGALHTAESMGNAIGSSTTAAFAYITHPVVMRATPTATYPTASLLALSDGTTSTALTVVATQEGTARLIRIACTAASGLAQYRPFQLVANASLSGYIDFAAEL